MARRGQVEQCGTESSGAFQGQPLYQIKKNVAWTQEEWAVITQYLEGANEELLGLHRYGVLTYEQYTEVADLLVEAQERLKKHMGASGSQ
jgi:hypothetical protein